MYTSLRGWQEFHMGRFRLQLSATIQSKQENDNIDRDSLDFVDYSQVSLYDYLKLLIYR